MCRVFRRHIRNNHKLILHNRVQYFRSSRTFELKQENRTFFFFSIGDRKQTPTSSLSALARKTLSSGGISVAPCALYLMMHGIFSSRHRHIVSVFPCRTAKHLRPNFYFLQIEKMYNNKRISDINCVTF